MLENKFAYGLSSEAIASAPGRYHCRLIALPERVVTVWIDAEGKLHATVLINGKVAELVRIYVMAVDRTMRTPKVEYIDLVGIDESGNAVHERMIPK
jgi:hypothetical protein